MTAIDYARFDTRRLYELLEHSTRTEEDFHIRLEARLKKRREVGGANRAPNPDPVAKRLAFLLAKARAQRQAVAQELVTRPLQDLRPFGGAKASGGNRCTDEPAPNYDDTPVKTRQTVPAVVA